MHRYRSWYRIHQLLHTRLPLPIGPLACRPVHRLRGDRRRGAGLHVPNTPIRSRSPPRNLRTPSSQPKARPRKNGFRMGRPSPHIQSHT